MQAIVLVGGSLLARAVRYAAKALPEADVAAARASGGEGDGTDAAQGVVPFCNSGVEDWSRPERERALPCGAGLVERGRDFECLDVLQGGAELVRAQPFFEGEAVFQGQQLAIRWRRFLVRAGEGRR